MLSFCFCLVVSFTFVLLVPYRMRHFDILCILKSSSFYPQNLCVIIVLFFYYSFERWMNNIEYKLNGKSRSAFYSDIYFFMCYFSRNWRCNLCIRIFENVSTIDLATVTATVFRSMYTLLFYLFQPIFSWSV